MKKKYKIEKIYKNWIIVEYRYDKNDSDFRTIYIGTNRGDCLKYAIENKIRISLW